MDEPIRIYVGADRSQKLAVEVLEYSIRRHTTAAVELIPMVDIQAPQPRDPRQWQRTGFSFSRFCIPELAGYHGRAIYMDADMLVFSDIRELWNIPFDGRKILIQNELKHLDETLVKSNAPVKRVKQTAVMLLDCGNLDWNINDIVGRLDAGDYNYEQLLYDMSLITEDEIGYAVPFEWNSLEYYDAETRLIHFTDMGTQPWVSTANPNGYLWLSEVRHMIASGALSMQHIQAEIDAGYFRPSLIRDLKWRHLLPRLLLPLFDRINRRIDRASGYIPHKAVYDAKRKRNQASKEYERNKG